MVIWTMVTWLGLCVAGINRKVDLHGKKDTQDLEDRLAMDEED